MTVSSKIRKLFRGDVPFFDLPREALRRKKVVSRQKQERRDLENLHNAPARLASHFASTSTAELLTHYRERNVSFFPIKDLDKIAKLQPEHFPVETAQLVADASIFHKDNRYYNISFSLNVFYYFRKTALAYASLFPFVKEPSVPFFQDFVGILNL